MQNYGPLISANVLSKYTYYLNLSQNIYFDLYNFYRKVIGFFHFPSDFSVISFYEKFQNYCPLFYNVKRTCLINVIFKKIFFICQS